MRNTAWKTEPFNAAKLRDDLWLEVICQTNSEIACSPRNSFRTSGWSITYGGRALNERGGQRLTNLNQTPNAKSRTQPVGLRVMRFVVERETAQIIG